MISKFVEPNFDIDDIVCRMTKSEWNTAEFLHWHDILVKKGFKISNTVHLFVEVQDRFDTFHEEMDAAFNVTRKTIVAEKGICQSDSHQIIHIDSIEGIGTEFESLDGFYCPTCNKFWREP